MRRESTQLREASHGAGAGAVAAKASSNMTKPSFATHQVLGFSSTALVALSLLAGCSALDEEYVQIEAPIGTGHEVRAYENSITEVAVVSIEDGLLEARMPSGGKIVYAHKQRSSPSEDFFVRTTEVNDVRPGEVISVGGAVEEVPADCICQSHEDPDFDRDAATIIITVQHEPLAITRRIRSAKWGDLTALTPGWYLTCQNESYDSLRERVGRINCGME